MGLIISLRPMLLLVNTLIQIFGSSPFRWPSYIVAKTVKILVLALPKVYSQNFCSVRVSLFIYLFVFFFLMNHTTLMEQV